MLHGGGYSVQDGPLATATLGRPQGITVDPAGNIYFTENMQRGDIRKIANGMVTCLNNQQYSQGYTDGPIAVAKFNAPYFLTADAKGNVFVSDFGNAVIRKIDFSSGTGLVTTFAGVQAGQLDRMPPVASSWYIDGPALHAKIMNPYGVAVDAKGNVYLADQQGYIRKVSNDPIMDSSTLNTWNNPRSWGNPHN